MNPYRTFWRRTGAIFIDGLVLSPLTLAPIVAMVFNHGISLAAYLAFSGLTTIACAAYYIVMPALRGQTLGKMATGVRIVKTGGGAITPKEAFLRYLPGLLIGLLISIPTFIWLSRLPVIDMSSMGTLPKWINWINMSWFLAELITLFCNPRRRAVHDFVAGTEVVVIKDLPPVDNPPPVPAAA